MPTFISMLKYTPQGIKAIRETTKRAAAMKAAAKKFGIKIINTYWTMGKYDGVLIFDAPDDKAATALMLSLGTLGNLQSTTVRAFNAGEMDKILAKMGG